MLGKKYTIITVIKTMTPIPKNNASQWVNSRGPKAIIPSIDPSLLKVKMSERASEFICVGKKSATIAFKSPVTLDIATMNVKDIIIR